MTYRLVVICAAVVMTGTPQANAATLTTLFAYDNGQNGNMFDVNVFANPLTVTSLDLNLSSGTWDMELYIKSGSYVGSDMTVGDWTLIDSVLGVIANGIDVPTPVDFFDFVLPASSTTAIYVTATNGSGMNYTDGTVEGAVYVSNADLAILEGLGKEYPFDFSFSPRVWNGTIHYTGGLEAVPEASSLSLLALGALALYARSLRSKKA